MSSTKHFALPGGKTGKSTCGGWLFLSLALSLCRPAAAQGQWFLLPVGEQDAVDEAIGRGVGYLKRTRQKSGTWAKGGVSHRIGYAILPALTLLECDVPPSDPSIQQAAQYLRARASKLDTTYDLALGTLFLDRLGDPKDNEIIQTFALRLVAGQSATGGWGYKCPLLSNAAQMELLTVLRQLDPRPNGMPGIAGKPGGMPGIAGKPGGMPGIAGNPGGMPGIAGKPGGLPGIAGEPGKKPGDLDAIAPRPGGSPLTGVAGQPAAPSLSGGLAGNGLGQPLSPQALIPAPSRWRDCLGLGILDSRDREPLDSDALEQAAQKEAPAKLKDRANPAPPKPDKPFVIPKRLWAFTVVQDPALHDLEDPRGMRNNLIVTTTDNSNTQFAILALWTAQRYDVPVKRTLNLIVRRYLTSQNRDGSWNYHYHFGGGFQHESFSSAGAMTCVGLIGLAVGHGLAQPVPAGQLVQDPRLLRALIALYAMVGKPSDRLTKMPLQNLYFLWSLERVAVLYRMPKIGDKDWYRWGAQILVTNQDVKGSWAGGGYPGNSPTLDTCLALLFLKRANLAKDLTDKLPFKAADLNHGIMENLTPSPSSSPPPKTPPEPPKTPESNKKTTSAVEPSKHEAADNLLGKPLSSLQGSASAGAAASEDAATGASGGKVKWVVLALILFVLFAGGSLFVLFAARQRDADEEETNGKSRKRKNTRKPQSAR